jgi:hypothetical protein
MALGNNRLLSIDILADKPARGFNAEGRTFSMPNVRRLLAGLLLLTPLAGAADPALLDFIMPDARVVVGIDIAHIAAGMPASATVCRRQSEVQKLMDRFRSHARCGNPVCLAREKPPALVARGTSDRQTARSRNQPAADRRL